MTITSEHTVPLHCQQEGAGRPLLILHGLLGASANFAGLARELGGRYRVLRADLRNHGRSPHTDAMNYPLMAADVLRLLDDQGVESCAVVGHSMGGKVAMQLALTHPERVACLVVVDIAPDSYPAQSHDDVLRALADIDLDAIASRAEADRELRERIADQALRQFLLTNLQRSGEHLAWRVNVKALLAHRGDIAAAPSGDGRFTGPCLFIKGAESDYIGPDHPAAIARYFPQARLRIVQGAGHWVHADKPAAFGAAVARFLERAYPVVDTGTHPQTQEPR
jgi:esterase